MSDHSGDRCVSVSTQDACSHDVSGREMKENCSLISLYDCHSV